MTRTPDSLLKREPTVGDDDTVIDAQAAPTIRELIDRLEEIATEMNERNARTLRFLDKYRSRQGTLDRVPKSASIFTECADHDERT